MTSDEIRIRDCIVNDTYKWDWDNNRYGGVSVGGNAGVAYRWLQTAIESDDELLAKTLLKRFGVPDNLTVKESISYIILLNPDITKWGRERFTNR